MDNAVIWMILLGGLSVILAVAVAALTAHKKWVPLANFILSLILWLVRAVVLNTVSILSDGPMSQNRDAINWTRNSYWALMIWTIISALIVLFFSVLVPLLHKYFRIERTPAGIPDKIVRNIY